MNRAALPPLLNPPNARSRNIVAVPNGGAFFFP
jgi:hypothetical protein